MVSVALLAAVAYSHNSDKAGSSRNRRGRAGTIEFSGTGRVVPVTDNANTHDYTRLLNKVSLEGVVVGDLSL